MLTVQRQELRGRRYRVAIQGSVMGAAEWSNHEALTRCFRDKGAACALAVLTPGAATTAEFRKRVATYRRDANTLVTLRQLCDTALASAGLPDGFGFFVEEAPAPGVLTLSAAAAIAVLAARSGPLYLPGRFEPSLITAGAVTLFFPCSRGKRGISMNDLTLRVLNAIPGRRVRDERAVVAAAHRGDRRRAHGLHLVRATARAPHQS